MQSPLLSSPLDGVVGGYRSPDQIVNSSSSSPTVDENRDDVNSFSLNSTTAVPELESFKPDAIDCVETKSILDRPEAVVGNVTGGDRDKSVGYGADYGGRNSRPSTGMSVGRKKTCILKLDDCHYTIGETTTKQNLCACVHAGIK
jgi:hypothetical protein